jgi:hypothetical protein
VSVDHQRLRTVRWRRVDGSGTEECRLSWAEGRPQIEGSVLVAIDGVSWRIEYTVDCDVRWQTHEVIVRATGDGSSRSITLRADRRGHWWVDDRGRADLDGCLDVDLSFTPSTNTLPIRRLELPMNQAADVCAAWVRFPELTVERLAQRYTRIGDGRYLYESRSGAFQAELLVDEDGVVRSYPGGWEQVEGG